NEDQDFKADDDPTKKYYQLLDLIFDDGRQKAVFDRLNAIIFRSHQESPPVLDLLQLPRGSQIKFASPKESWVVLDNGVAFIYYVVEADQINVATLEEALKKFRKRHRIFEGSGEDKKFANAVGSLVEGWPMEKIIEEIDNLT